MHVFVSSTYSDLLDYRMAVTRAVLVGGDMPEDMLYWPAEEDPPLDVCLRRLRGSDLVVLITAHRYGTILPGHDLSITELEFTEAVEKGIPVLAFEIDPEYAWKPKFIDNESQKKKLQRFRERISAHAAKHSFTTPESLETVVSQAIAAYRAREFEKTPTGRKYAEHRVVQRRQNLEHSPDSLVRVGKAPDQSPLLLDVKRSVSLGPVMTIISNAIGRPTDDPYLQDLFKKLDYEARSHAITTGVCRTASPSNEILTYVTHKPLVQLLSASIPELLLRRSPETLDSFYKGRDKETKATILSGLESRMGWDKRVVSVAGKNRFLCINLDNFDAWSGGWGALENGVPRFCIQRQFVEEGFERFKGITYRIHRKTGSSDKVIVNTMNPTEFHSYWRELLIESGDGTASNMRCDVSVPRASIVNFIREVAIEVGQLHRIGRIHGDIKPSNVLASRRGQSLIDEVGLIAGEVSPTVTVDWSPPEQLCREPISFSADVYPLGLLLLNCLGCEQLGRTVSYCLPGGKTASVIENPAVYAPPSHPALPSRNRNQWLDLIERSLRTDPRERWKNAAEFAKLLEAASSSPPGGAVIIPFPLGERPALIRDENGEIGSGWVLVDQINTTAY